MVYPTGFQRYRWTAFGLLVTAYMLVFFHRMAPAVVSEDLMRSFSTTGAELGSLAAMYYFIYTAMQIPSGVLSDTVGPRFSIGLGMLVAGFGTWLFAQAGTLEAASLGRFCVGLGVSVVFVGLMKNNTVWFRHKHAGLLSGTTVFLGNCGSILAAGPMALVLKQMSWQNAFEIIAISTVIIAVLILLFVRNSPSDVGLPSITQLEGAPEAKAHQTPWYTLLWQVVTTRKIWPAFCVHFGVTGTMFAFAGLWSLPLMRDVHGLDRTGASLYTTVILIGFALGPMLAGWLSDRIGLRKPVVVVSVVMTLVAWLWMISGYWQPGWSGLLAYFAVGFLSGGVVVLYPVAKEVGPKNAAGMSIALANTGLFLGAAVAQPLFGKLADWRWDGTMVDGVRVYSFSNYQDGLWFYFGLTLLGLVAAVLLTETRCQHIEHKHD